MTPALVLPPVDVARALAQSGPVVIGLGELDLTCTTCGGSGHDPSSNPFMDGGFKTCVTCQLVGQVSLVSGLHTLATTTAKADRIGDWAIVPPSSIVTNGEWLAQRWEGSTVMERLPIHVGAILGTCLIGFLTVYEGLSGPTDRAHIIVSPDGESIWLHKAIPQGEVEVLSDVIDITGAPGLFKPGGWAAVLTEWDPTIPCPECEGSLSQGEPGYVYCGIPEPGSFAPCDRCMDDRGIPGRVSCPVSWSAPDHPTYLREGVTP